MAKKDVDLDDFDLDDFDLDIPEWKSDTEIDDTSRKPIERATKGAIKGAKEALTTPSAIRKAMTLALPQGYGLAADTIENVATDARDLYDKVAHDSPEIIKGSRAFGRRAMNLVGNKVLSKKTADRINNALEDYDEGPVKSTADYKKEQEDNDLAQLAEIFKAKTGADEERAKLDSADDLEKKTLEQVRFKSNIEVLSAINKAMARMVGYQDKITARYQQKMLELNYRQYGTQKQLLDVMAEASQKQAQILEAIRHNTGLPEAVKIRGSEMFKQMAHQRLMSGGLNTISNWTQNYTKHITDNIQGIISGAMDGVGAGKDLLESTGMDKSTLAGYSLGKGLGDGVRDYAAIHVAPHLQNNKYIAKGGEKLRNTFSGLPQKINEYAQSDTQGNGYKAVLTQAFKSFLPQFSLNSNTGGDRADMLDDIGTFDKISRRSLIEVIPGHLAEIAFWSKAAVTGDLTADKQVYNPVRGGFSGEKEQLADVSRQVMSRSERDSLKSSSDSFLKTIGADSLSGRAQKALKLKLIDELANGRDLVPKRLADHAQYPNVDPDTVDEIVNHINDSFGLDYNGERVDNSAEGLTKFNDTRDQYLSMASMVPAVGDRIRILSDVLGKDSMRKLGYVERQGRDDRISYDKIWGNLFDEDDVESKGGTAEGNQDVNHPLPNRNDSTTRHPPANIDDAIRAIRADDMVPPAASEGKGLQGLEHFLGDKSTLIGIITQSRDFHSETVELLKKLTECGCREEDMGERVDRKVRDFSGSASKALKKARRGGRRLKIKGLRQWNKTAESRQGMQDSAKELWDKTASDPKVQAAKDKALSYRDKTMSARDEFMESDRYKDIKDKVAKYVDTLPVSAEEAKAILEKTYRDMEEGGISKYNDLKDKTTEKYKDVRSSETMAEALAKLKPNTTGIRKTLTDAKDRLKGSADKHKAKFKPRVKNLMKRFLGGKTGGDVSSELTGDHDQDMLTLSLRSVQLQYETLKEVTKEKVRKGSFSEINAKRNAAIDKVKEMAGGKKEQVQGLLSKAGGLKGLLGMLGIGGGDGEGEGKGGMLSGLLDLVGLGGEGRDKRTRKRRAGRTGKLGKITNWGGKVLDKMGTAGSLIKTGAKAAGLGWAGTKLAGKLGWKGLKGVGSVAKWGFKGARAVLTNPLTRTVLMNGARLAGQALVGAAGLVSAPVLIAVGVAAAGIAVGAYIYSRNKNQLPPLTRLRMVQYGIKPKAESDEFKTLIAIEKLYSDNTSVDSEGKATVNVKSIPVEKIVEILKIDTNVPASENETMRRAMTFLQGRFSAVFLQHISNYYALTKSTDLTQIDAKVTGSAALGFVNKVSMADRPEIFNAMTAPFEDEKLSMDAGDVTSAISDAINEIKEVMSNDKEKDKTGAEKLATATTAGVVGSQLRGEAAKRAVAAQNTNGEEKPASDPKNPNSLSTGSKPQNADISAKDLGSAAIVSTAVVAASTAANSSSIDDGRPVRYRTYGLTEMLEIKIRHLSTLEDALFPLVTYDGDKRATIKDGDQAYRIVDSLFSPIGGESEDVYVWYNRRFLPTFLQYCTSVRARANIDAKDAATRLKPQDLLEVLRETANARDNSGISVWDITQSPWPGYALNDDQESVKEPLFVISQMVKDKTVEENAKALDGQVRDKDGKVIEKDSNQVNRPASADGKTDPSKASTPGGEEPGMVASAWNKVKGWFGGDDGKKSPQPGNVNAQGQPSETASGPATFTPGTPLTHMGGGTGGDINAVPEPKGDGWDATKDTLMAAANMVGVDPGLAASIAGVESNYRPDAVPYKNPRDPSQGVLSSAASFYQVIKGTWQSLMGKYAGKYGINPNTTQRDPRANALLGLEYIKENVNTIKKVKPDVTDTDVYMAHFLGPGGASRFLKAPPGDPAINHVAGNQASSNPAIFYDKSGRPRTVAAVYNDFDDKLKKHRKSDASQVASAINGGAVTPAGPDDTSVADTASGAPQAPTLKAEGPNVPSMVKPSGGVPEAVAAVPDQAVAPVSADLSDKADERATQSTVAPMTVAARTADIQSAAQTAANSDTYGGMDKQFERLITVGEEQRELLRDLVQMVRNGSTVMPNVAEAKPSQQVAATTQNSRLNKPVAAPNGTVSVGRV